MAARLPNLNNMGTRDTSCADMLRDLLSGSGASKAVDALAGCACLVTAMRPGVARSTHLLTVAAVHAMNICPEMVTMWNVMQFASDGPSMPCPIVWAMRPSADQLANETSFHFQTWGEPDVVLITCGSGVASFYGRLATWRRDTDVSLAHATGRQGVIVPTIKSPHNGASDSTCVPGLLARLCLVVSDSPPGCDLYAIDATFDQSDTFGRVRSESRNAIDWWMRLVVQVYGSELNNVSVLALGKPVLHALFATSTLAGQSATMANLAVIPPLRALLPTPAMSKVIVDSLCYTTNHDRQPSRPHSGLLVARLDAAFLFVVQTGMIGELASMLDAYAQHQNIVSAMTTGADPVPMHDNLIRALLVLHQKIFAADRSSFRHYSLPPEQPLAEDMIVSVLVCMGMIPAALNQALRRFSCLTVVTTPGLGLTWKVNLDVDSQLCHTVFHRQAIGSAGRTRSRAVWRVQLPFASHFYDMHMSDSDSIEMQTETPDASKATLSAPYDKPDDLGDWSMLTGLEGDEALELDPHTV